MFENYNPLKRDIGHWEKKVSWRGYPYWIWRPSMPRIQDAMLDAVFFIFRSEKEAVEGENGGTGFFFFVPSEVNPQIGYLYAVTCAHIIFADGFDKPIIRINTQGGKFDLIETDRKNWERSADASDIAACLFKSEPKHHKTAVFNREHILSKEFMNEHNVGVGDDVIMAGEFWGLIGNNKNIPTVRFGNIARMLDEPIFNQFTGLKEDSFLVEMRSASGCSGSPALLTIEPLSYRYKQGTKAFSKEWRQKLLGINWGHITHKEPVMNQSEEEYFEKLHVAFNTTMACVTPSWKLLEIIDGDAMKKVRDEIDKKLRELKNKAIVELDLKSDKVKEFTQEEFEDMLRIISFPIKPDDQEKKGT